MYEKLKTEEKQRLGWGGSGYVLHPNWQDLFGDFQTLKISSLAVI